ncbi:hypothetical protein BU16DRAFT_127768 [Lophium mytilinum]|uniref:Uncharacterized protein n=1 Tax=Lophium mytilinum TaxID=390894 RepID=A0A6A6QJA4_9PEZI|nr:hypothetical protein BU16DRAFT_127768 [Lophium mytilinum]
MEGLLNIIKIHDVAFSGWLAGRSLVILITISSVLQIAFIAENAANCFPKFPYSTMTVVLSIDISATTLLLDPIKRVIGPCLNHLNYFTKRSLCFTLFTVDCRVLFPSEVVKQFLLLPTTTPIAKRHSLRHCAAWFSNLS